MEDGEFYAGICISVYPSKKNRGTAGDVSMFLCNLGLTADKSRAGKLPSPADLQAW